jgi:OPT family small oligopeptide transporter
VLWQGLSVFAFVTWINPNDVGLNQLFGGFTGLSLIPLTFDWTYVSAYLQDPLLAPVDALCNVLAGLIIFVIIPTIGISYTGWWYSDYLPVNTVSLFDNTQSNYNVTRILGRDFTFDLEEYSSYSPVFLAPTFVINHGLSFAALTSAVVDMMIFHGKEVWYRLRTARNQKSDVYMEMMRRYPDAPDWWYGILFIFSISLGLTSVLTYPSQLPWWAFFVSNLLAFVFVIPTCMIYAVTNVFLTLHVLSPLIAGFIIPGHPIGLIIFKVFSTIILAQAQTFSSDLKMAHYMKIPPRTTFACQVAASIWACFVQTAVLNWTLKNVAGVCEA